MQNKHFDSLLEQLGHSGHVREYEDLFEKVQDSIYKMRVILAKLSPTDEGYPNAQRTLNELLALRSSIILSYRKLKAQMSQISSLKRGYESDDVNIFHMADHESGIDLFETGLDPSSSAYRQ